MAVTKTKKGQETMRVPVVADGPFKGSRAVKRFATNGLSPAFLDSTAEISVFVTEAEVSVNVFALLDGSPDQQRRGTTPADFKGARRTALKLGKSFGDLDASTAWASKSLAKTPTEREPKLEFGWEARAEVFQLLFARVGAGETSEVVLAEVARGDDERLAVAAVQLIRPGQPGLADWFWHPGLGVPPATVDSAQALFEGTEERAHVTDDDITRTRHRVLHDLFPATRGKVREAVARELIGGSRTRELLDSEERMAFGLKVLESLEAQWDTIESEGDSYARDAMQLAASGSPERCLALTENSPKGWKTHLKKAIKKPV